MESSHSNNDNIDDMYNALKELCINNQDYFKKYDDDECSQRLCLGLQVILDHIKVLKELLKEFRHVANEYDYTDIPANGYRSFIMITDSFVVICTKICKEICINRGHLFFKKSQFTKDIEISGQVFASLVSCFEILKFLRGSSPPGNLFLEDAEKIKESLRYIDKVNLYCFFGRFVGYQYCDSMKPIVRTLCVMMATFGAVYYGDNSSILSRTNSCKNVLIDPEIRANEIVKISQYRSSSVQFCKAFWNLSELELVKLSSNIFTSIAVNKVFAVNFEPIQCTNLDGSVVDIPLPASYIENKSVQVRLISAKRRNGMDLDGKGAVAPASKGILFHCHGGGFVAQTSGSHQSYLKDWSFWTDVPIISVDYSLAPEAPYPRALEEILYVYAWILNNASTLGTSAEKIIFAGDSAGANLCLSLAIKCADLNIRIPDGLFLAYLPVLASITPTPARMLCLLDPLLPFGFMINCIKAYNRGVIKSSGIFDDTVENFNVCSELSEELSEIEDGAHSVTEKNNRSFSEGNDERVCDGENSNNNEDKILFHINSGAEQEITLPTKFKKITDNFMKRIKRKLSTGNIIWRNNEPSSKRTYESEPVEKFIDEVPLDMYLSPYLADEKLLKQLPPISLMTLQLDPCLDDCIMLAKKLNNIGNKVILDVLSGLPHGFLNLSNMSKEAKDGSKLCAQRIKELFGENN